MSIFGNRLRAFRKEQEGSATIEFVVLFPAFIFLFLTGFESGYYMVRNVMLERAVDVAVRDVRLGNGKVPEFAALKDRICAEASIIPDCQNSIQIEMQSINVTPGGTTPLRAAAKCVDQISTADPLTGTVYDVGGQNQLMMVRVCALSQPLFPTTGIGVGMKVDSLGNYALVATSAFVNEPGNRGMASYNSGAPMGGPIGNNGFGNGDQMAPGESLEYNGAENDQTPGNSTINNNSNNGNGGF